MSETSSTHPFADGPDAKTAADGSGRERRAPGSEGPDSPDSPAAPPPIAADLRRILPVWLILFATAVATLWWFGQSGSRILARLAYTSPSKWEVARVYRADGEHGWRDCLDRVAAMRSGTERLGSAVGVLEGDRVLRQARENLLRSFEFHPFENVPGMLADLTMWDGDAAGAYAWRGEQAALKKEWDHARLQFAIAHEMGDRSARVLDGRLEASIRLGEWDRAAALATEPRDDQADPPTARHHRLVAEIHRRSGERDRQETALRQALELDPRDVEAVIALATLLEATGRADEAFAEYDKATRLVTNNGRLWHLYAGLAKRLDRRDDAIRLYRSALAVEPNIFNLHYELALLYVASGRPARAKPHLARAFELNPAEFEKRRTQE